MKMVISGTSTDGEVEERQTNVEQPGSKPSSDIQVDEDGDSVIEDVNSFA
jgi:hypothetical protein